MLFCKQVFFKKTFSFTFYINILYYICNVLSLLKGSITKDLSMKECREEHRVPYLFANDHEVKNVGNSIFKC